MRDTSHEPSCGQQFDPMDIGEILDHIYHSEINFRLESNWDNGYRWAIIGYEGKPAPGEIRFRRAEIDDSIQGFLTFHTEDGRRELNLPHFIQKDWLVRGASSSLRGAVTELCEAICNLYPDTPFSHWYREEKRGTD